ncbi:MAG: hypothetical protein M1426_05415 [Patescibacteria group bacterium]|nr:hypothetical protein [Patescibacteria group bacterium]
MFYNYLDVFRIRNYPTFLQLFLLLLLTLYAHHTKVGFTQNLIQSDSPIVKPLPFSYRASTFRADSGKTLLHIALSLPRRELEFEESMFGKGKCPLNILFELRNLKEPDLHRYNEQIIIWNNSTKTDMHGYILIEKKITSAPGKYVLTIQINTLDSKKFGRQSDTISIPSFSGDSLLLSSIQLAYRIDEPEESQMKEPQSMATVVPYPLQKILYNYPVFAFFEIYNLAHNEKGNALYQINYQVFEQDISPSLLKKLLKKKGEKPIMNTTIKRESIQQTVSDYISFDPAKINKGNLLLTITVQDEITKNYAQTSIPFETIDEHTRLIR